MRQSQIFGKISLKYLYKGRYNILDSEWSDYIDFKRTCVFCVCIHDK